MPLLLTLLALLALVLLVAWLKLETFIAFLLVSLAFGLTAGLDVPRTVTAITRGIGGTLGSLVIILGFGAMLGKLVGDSGAAQRITVALLRTLGGSGAGQDAPAPSSIARVQWALALAGFIVGIPLFYTAGFFILIPIVLTVIRAGKLPLLPTAIPVTAALSVAHGYLPPHPAPTAIAQQLHASLSLTMIYGIIVAIPAIAIGGPLFARTLRRATAGHAPPAFATPLMSEERLPGLATSLVSALMPLLLLGGSALALPWLPAAHPFTAAVRLAGEPHIAMLVSVLVAVYLLGLRRGQTMPAVMRQLEDGFKSVAMLLLIIAGAGAFMQVLSESGVNTYIGQKLDAVRASPLVVGWAIAAAIRVSIGSATVAGLTTVGLMLPLVAQQPVSPELMVLAIGSGSLMFSHLNDGGFWIFKEYFDLSIKETLATWSVMETIVSVAGLIGVLVLDLFV
jgi:Gnt-I system high-affinity gluconate transporter